MDGGAAHRVFFPLVQVRGRKKNDKRVANSRLTWVKDVLVGPADSNIQSGFFERCATNDQAESANQP